MTAAILPQHDGLLPDFLLYISPKSEPRCFPEAKLDLNRRESLPSSPRRFATLNKSPSAALRQFSGPASPTPTGLLARVYGVKNIYTSLIRLYAAYHITNGQLYVLAILTFAGVLFLYVTELTIHKTVRVKEGVFSFINAGSGLVWMVLQREWYRNL
ncbi:ergosterol biosynthesis protein-like protein Erg28 [Xylariales sp. AK1849]|nr:ergosterol biosynthesis protein-like protein Erg28 [Xylariales sp. AK1849]